MAPIEPRQFSMDELKQLLGQQTRLRVWLNHMEEPVCEGDFIAIAEVPTIMLRDDKGVQHAFVHSLRMAVVPPALQEYPDGTTVTVLAPPDQYHSEPRLFAFTRRDKERADLYGGHSGEHRWWWHDNGDWVRWKELVGMGEVLQPATVVIPTPVPEEAWAAAARGFEADLAAASRFAALAQPAGPIVPVIRNSCPTCYSFQRFSRVACADAWHQGVPNV